MIRYGSYAINLSLEDVWNKTLVFFEKHKSKIEDRYISSNNLYRKLRMRHGFSMHLYGSSIGETYELTFGYNPYNSITYVRVSVKYSNFGRGIPSKVPKDMMKKWAHELGIIPMKLVKEIDYNFLDILDKIQAIPQHQIEHFSKVFCPMCGEVNSNKNDFCVFCGSRVCT
jgi:hypothetical protein